MLLLHLVQLAKQSQVAAGACCAGIRFIFCMQTTWRVW